MAMHEGLEEGEEGEVERLFRFLTRPGPRFGLALAVFRDEVVAEQLRSSIERQVSAQGASVRTMMVQRVDERSDLIAGMADAIEGADCLFVVGLETLLLDSAGRNQQTSAVANLNVRRDELPTRIDARVVLWLSEASYPNFRHAAWDLHEVMLTVAEFTRSSVRLTKSATLRDFQERSREKALVEELAKVIWGYDQAIILLSRVGFPRAEVPSFSTPRVFWSRVGEYIRDGGIKGGLDALADAAAEQYPANPIFQAAASLSRR